MCFYKDQLTLLISVLRSSKIRTRKVATGLSNMNTGLTSVGTDSGKEVRGRRLIKMNFQVTEIKVCGYRLKG